MYRPSIQVTNHLDQNYGSSFNATQKYLLTNKVVFDTWIKMVNFVLGNKCEWWINVHDTSMGQKKIWMPDSNRTYDLPNTERALYPLGYENSWGARSFYWVHMWQVSCILVGLLMMTSTVLILAVCGTPVIYELSKMTFLSMSSRSSVDRAPARCSRGHGFDSRRGLRYFLCPMLVSCRLIHHSQSCFYFLFCFEEQNWIMIVWKPVLTSVCVILAKLNAKGAQVNNEL